MNDIKNMIREIIQTESKKDVIQQDGTIKKHFSILNEDSVDLIEQILSNDTKSLHRDFNNIPKQADLIFVAAPTGAGKDGLVARLRNRNQDKNYIELNMDRFRLYYKNLIPNLPVKDKTYAEQTNELSYEIYYIIQEILLSEFPGTNIIITGTLRETDWVKETFEKYKSNKYTNYKITLAALAVPEKDCAFSILKRYVKNIDKYIVKKENDNIIYKSGFDPGSVRYTKVEYLDETCKRFSENFLKFQELHKKGDLIDCVEVFIRAPKENDYSNDRKVYSSEWIDDKRDSLDVIEYFRSSEPQLKDEDIRELYRIMNLEKNKCYLKEQQVYEEIEKELEKLLIDKNLLRENDSDEQILGE